MLSRRSVRVKIMQLLYTKDRDDSLSSKQIFDEYKNSVVRSFDLFLFVIHLFVKIPSNATEDAKLRKAKHLPSDYDKAFSSKLFDNEITQAILRDETLQRRFKKLGFLDMDLDDFASKMYKGFAKTEEYKTYILAAETKQRDLDALLELFRFLRSNEYFNEICDEKFINWVDEKSLIVGAIKKYLKALPGENGHYETFYPDEETVKDFGNKLLTTVLKDDEKYHEMIIPVLKNWDSDRVAILDMILIKMALCEMLTFTSIPGTVTINEYVEIAKLYSTDKSKEFVNGVLDTLMKSLPS